MPSSVLLQLTITGIFHLLRYTIDSKIKFNCYLCKLAVLLYLLITSSCFTAKPVLRLLSRGVAHVNNVKAAPP